MKWLTIVATATALCWFCYGYVDIPVAEYIHTNTTPALRGVGAMGTYTTPVLVLQ